MILIGSAFLTSCNKNDTVSPDGQSIVATDVVQSALRVAYPNATNVTYSEVSTTAVEVAFTNKNDQLLAGISKEGKLLYSATAIDEASLPAIALDYLTANYPGYTLVRSGEKKDKSVITTGFVADIKYKELNYHLHFDSTGLFLTVTEQKGKHNGIGVKVTQANLPAAIKTYLDATYPAYIFDDAISFTVDGVIKGFGVRITTADNKEIGLMFDGTGVFLRSREGSLGHHSGKGPGKEKGKGSGRGDDGLKVVKIEISAVPAAAITYLGSKYAGYVLVNAESYTLDGVIKQYEVEFTLAGKTYEVYFDAAGVFSKEKIKK